MLFKQLFLSAIALSFFYSSNLSAWEFPKISPQVLERVQAEVDIGNDTIASGNKLGEGKEFDLTTYQKFIIKFKPQVDMDSSATVQSLSAFGATAQKTYGNRLLIKVSPYAIEIDTNLQPIDDVRDRTAELVEAMKNDDAIDSFYPNVILETKVTNLPNDPLLKFQWHYNTVASVPGGASIFPVWEKVTTGSPKIVIAILDTGIIFNHSDIAGNRVLRGYDMISNNNTANDPDLGRDADATDPGDDCGYGDSWHGTHVAGIIAALKANNAYGGTSVVFSAKVLPIRVLGKCGGSLQDILLGYQWAAGLLTSEELQELGIPTNQHNIKVINMSLGSKEPGPCPKEFQKSILEARNRGILTVVAAGNESDDASKYFPANCKGVLSVAAGDYSGTLARYSNYGNTVDIMAPGGDIQTDINGDGLADGVLSAIKGGFKFMNGTSMAAPHVSGVAGLILSAAPSITVDQTEALLRTYATPRTREECPKACGDGLLNAAASFGLVAHHEQAAQVKK